MATHGSDLCCVINDGDHVLCNKDKVTKVFQVKRGRKVYFGKQKLYLDGALGFPYGCVFEIKDKHLKLVKTSLVSDAFAEADEIEGKDNRFLNDDGRSQKLSKDDIEALKDKGLSGKEIIEHLVENSTTFNNKNEYSKVKYLKKKQSKYFNYIRILRPTTRLLVEMYYAQGPLKILNLRMDSLSQILTLSDIHSGGCYLMIESCMGLIVGATLERLSGHGKLINIYSGDIPTLNTVNAYNFSECERRCLLNLNIKDIDCDVEKIDLCSNSTSYSGATEITSPDLPSAVGSESKRKAIEENPERLQRRQRRNVEKKEALQILKLKNLDGLIIASKYHPANLLLRLLSYLAYSRSFVIFCPYKEPLIECYGKLKDGGGALMLYLSETWCRSFQVLPKRTHPMINMSGSSGYILTGITAESVKKC